jgi:hypothetical protein
MKHINNISSFIKKLSTSTKYLLSAIIISASALIFTAVAAPPSSNYTPGETLAPTCSPGDSNCTITTPAISGANTDITAMTALTSVGIGTAVPSSSLHIVSTTEQLRLGYNASNYAVFEVDSGGEMVIGATGAIIFSDAVTMENNLLVKNSNEDPVLNVDTTGNKVGIGAFPDGDNPQAALHASSSVAEVMRLSNSVNNYTSFSISAGGLEILPSGTGIVEIGDLGSADKIGASNDDLFIGDELEVNGQAYFDGTATFNATATTTFNQPVQVNDYIALNNINSGNDVNTVLLITGDGTEGGTTFNDLSTSNHTVTAVNEVQHTRITRLANNSSMLFDEVDDYLTVPNDSVFDIGTGDFTLEAWIYTDDVQGAGYRILSQGDLETNNGDWVWGFGTAWGGGFKMNFAVKDGALPAKDYTSTAIDTIHLAPYVWHHVAVSRSSGVLKYFWNGVNFYSVAVAHSITSEISSTVAVGARRYGGGSPQYIEEYNGLMDEVRFSNVARYTTDFTPVYRHSGQDIKFKDGSGNIHMLDSKINF